MAWHLSWGRRVSSWWAPSPPCLETRRPGNCFLSLKLARPNMQELAIGLGAAAGGLAPAVVRIEAGAGKKRVPRTESHKVRNLRSIKQLTGTTQRPRLLVFCSDKHLYAQIIDDTKKATLVSASTARHNNTAEEGSIYPILDAAKKVGEEIAMECLKQGFSRVIYYKRGTLHWKRVKTFRLAAEEFGLKFEYPD